MPTAVVTLYHWYVGAVPPLVGAAEKVTRVPRSTGFTVALEFTFTLAVRVALTLMVLVAILVQPFPSVYV